MSFKIIKQDIDPKFAIVTPLRPSDKISRDTKVSLKRNDIPLIWVSYKGDGNVVQNFKAGMKELENYIALPDYIIKIDNDTVWNRNTLDSMYTGLKYSNESIAYTYCSFKYVGAVNAKFDAIPFDSNKLKRANYISSNSMFKTKIIQEYEMIEDEKYKRLLDWTYYLHLLNNGFIGKPVKGYFEVKTKKDSVSAGSQEDYKLKHQRVKEDFID